MKTCIFNDHEVVSHLKEKRKLGRFVNELIFHYLQCDSQVSYTFVSDEFLHEMNLTHLNHDTYTDIITFDLTEKESTQIMADIYVSVDRVKENALLEKTTYPLELLRVILHGALHISGFGDNSTVKKKKMRILEREWMNQFLGE